MGGIALRWGAIGLNEAIRAEHLDHPAAHELSHVLMFAMSAVWKSWWEKLCGPDMDYNVYNRNPDEHFAEMGRLQLFPDQWPTPATVLPWVDAEWFVEGR